MLEFTNGVTASCDLLIGADGINSVVRGVLLAEGKDWTEEEITLRSRPIWNGVHAHRCLVDADAVRRESPDNRALKRITLVRVCLFFDFCSVHVSLISIS